ncbi:unnamed protein product, partial [Mesorhabditis spiculigera]
MVSVVLFIGCLLLIAAMAVPIEEVKFRQKRVFDLQVGQNYCDDYDPPPADCLGGWNYSEKRQSRAAGVR